MNQTLLVFAMLCATIAGCGNSTAEKSQPDTTQPDTDKDGVVDTKDAEPNNKNITGYVEVRSLDNKGHAKKVNGLAMIKIGFDKEGRITYKNSENGVYNYRYNNNIKIYDAWTPPNGKFQWIQKFDDTGNLLSAQRFNQNQILDYGRYNTYKNGALIKNTEDTNGDGKPERVRIYKYTDKNNYQIYDEKGVLRGAKITRHDSNGNRTEEVRDRDLGKGFWDIKTTTYTASGKKIAYRHEQKGEYTNQTTKKKEHFSQGDVYRYNLSGQQIYHKKYNNADTLETTTAQYDSRRNQTHYTHDANGDGTLEVVIKKTYEYDGNGNKLTEKMDDKDNKFKTSTTLKRYIKRYSYDDKNNLLGYEYDKHLDGTIDEAAQFHYNRANRLTKERYDFNGDGKWDAIKSYKYDAKNRVVQKTLDANGDGKLNLIRNYRYNSSDTVIEFTEDTNADNVIDKKVSYNQYGQILREEVVGRYVDVYHYIGAVSPKAKVFGFSRAKVPEDGFDHVGINFKPAPALAWYGKAKKP